MNKRLKTLLLLLSFSASGGAWAQFSVVNSSGGSTSSGGSAGAPVRSSPQNDQTPTALPSERRVCETSDRLSFQMLKNLMVTPSDYTISMVEGQGNKLKVQIPAHYGDCLELKFEYKISGNDVMVYATNNKTYTEYTTCLKDRGILNAAGNQFDASKATISEASFEYVDIPDFDRTKNVEAFFMSPSPNPANGNYGPAHASGWLSTNDTCSKRESLQEGGAIVYLSPENEAADRAFRACNSLDYEAILRELERLDASTLGNAALLKNVLQGALDTARNQRASEIYKRLGDIESQFRASDDDRAAGRTVGVTEDEAIRLSNEYSTLLKELNSVVLDPSIGEIDALITEHGQTSSRARQTEIQARIKVLNESVSEYSKRGSRGLRDLYLGLQEYALIDQAEVIEGFRLKSEAYGKVYVGRVDGRRGAQLSVEKANRFITDKMKTFMNDVAGDWEDSYRVRNLDRTPLRSSQRKVSQAYDRLQSNWQRYQKKEQEQMRRYCGSNFLGQQSNPVRCQQFQRGAASRERRALRTREGDLKRLRSRGQHYSSLSNQYGAALERFESERESSFDDMGIYGDYDDYSYSLYGSSYGGDDDYGMYDMGSMQMSSGSNMTSRYPASGGGNMMMMSPMMGANPYQGGVPQMQSPVGGFPMGPGGQFPQQYPMIRQ